MEDVCICTALRQAAAQSTAYYDAVLAPVGIKVTMFRLLRRIDEAGSICITELAEIVALDRSTLGRNLRVLEKQSLVKTGKGEDGRTRVVCLTGTGREALQMALPLWRVAQQDFAQMIGADTLALLAKVAAQPDKASPRTGDMA
ncbi:MarR family winged helix-turn-helix transcriptional regulator [uncultured Lentibacter sp.]|uniref:MarR family winged helix-turn-helix transcriptional regulator n=1 Tax=uncultured Lentibacter sp. TaxID=1659309 RepID=UPI0026386CCB|nr:MarR family winged helix-turn-helix transcriptional regulator [uncultured Lentibacter sp.]